MPDTKFKDIKSENQSSFLVTRWLYNKLKPSLKRELIFLVFLMATSSILEIIAIYAVVPFINSLSPSSPPTPVQELIANFAPYAAKNQSIIFGLCLIILTLIASVIRIQTLKSNQLFAAKCGSSFSYRAFSSTLNTPYHNLKQLDTSQIITSLTLNADYVVVVLTLLLQTLASAILSACIIFFLLLFDLRVTIVIVIVLSTSYYFIGRSVRTKLYQNSDYINDASQKIIASIQESLLLIEDNILRSRQSELKQRFSSLDKAKRLHVASNNFLNLYPKSILEVISICTLMAIALLLSFTANSTEVIYATLSVFALSAQKLLPSFQSLYAGWAGVKAYSVSVVNLLNLLNDSKQLVKPYNINGISALSLSNVSYSYSSGECPLKNINLTLKQGDQIGIIGKSGSGKSTLIRLIMGLLQPSAGNFNIYDDNSPNAQPLNSKLYDWQSQISYVPQDVQIFNGSISQNIALNHFDSEIDHERVILAAKNAEIHEYIDSLPYKYNSLTGENGSLLSGGQKQRIGIARALYRNFSLLILDEATSSLDRPTQAKVIKNINRLCQNKILLSIAHRQGALDHVGNLYRLESGEMVNLSSSTNY